MPVGKPSDQVQAGAPQTVKMKHTGLVENGSLRKIFQSPFGTQQIPGRHGPVVNAIVWPRHHGMAPVLEEQRYLYALQMRLRPGQCWDRARRPAAGNIQIPDDVNDVQHRLLQSRHFRNFLLNHKKNSARKILLVTKFNCTRSSVSALTKCSRTRGSQSQMVA